MKPDLDATARRDNLESPRRRPGTVQFSRDEQAIGLILWIIIAVGGLVAILGATAGILYANDFAIEATVIDKECAGAGGIFGNGSAGSNSVTVQTRLFGIEHTLADIPNDQCLLIQEDNFVRYRVQSERTSIWESEGGSCIWDTANGPGGCDA